MRDRHDETRSQDTNTRVSKSRRRRKPDGARKTIKSRDLLDACFEHAAIGFSVTDLDGRIVEVNPALCSLTGYTEAELRSTPNIQTLLHSSDVAAASEKTQSLMAGKVPAYDVELRYVKNNGSIVWVRESVSLVHDKAGVPVNIVRLTQDISQQKLAEESLRKIEAWNITERKRAQELL